MDVKYQFDFMHKLLGLLSNKDMVIIGVVHDLSLAARFAHQITLLNKGKVLAIGNRKQVLTSENLKAAYEIEMDVYENNSGFHIHYK